MRFEKINLLTCSLVLTLIAGTAIGQQQQAAHRFRIVNDRTSFTIPFELVDNRIFVSARLNGQGPFSFILDTGGYGAISTYAAHKSGLDLGAEVQGTGAGSNVVTARETAVKDFQLGLLHISDLDLRVFDFSDSRHVFGKRRLDGIIGLPVFERLVVRIDYIRRLITFTQPSSFHYSRRQIIFEKNSLYGRRDDYDRSGMWISESLDGKNFEITDVVANGPANVAGLKVGDKILSIDGQKTKTLPLLEARIKLKSSAPGHVVRMVVQSDTGQRRVDVILRDLV